MLATMSFLKRRAADLYCLRLCSKRPSHLLASLHGPVINLLGYEVNANLEKGADK